MIVPDGRLASLALRSAGVMATVPRAGRSALSVALLSVNGIFGHELGVQRRVGTYGWWVQYSADDGILKNDGRGVFCLLVLRMLACCEAVGELGARERTRGY